MDFVVVVNGVPAYGSATGVVDAYDINAGSILGLGLLMEVLILMGTSILLFWDSPRWSRVRKSVFR